MFAVVANALFVGLTVLTVVRTAILLVYVVVAEKEDPGAFDDMTKFSLSFIDVLRLLKWVLKAEMIDSWMPGTYQTWGSVWVLLSIVDWRRIFPLPIA